MQAEKLPERAVKKGEARVWHILKKHRKREGLDAEQKLGKGLHIVALQPESDGLLPRSNGLHPTSTLKDLAFLIDADLSLSIVLLLHVLLECTPAAHAAAGISLANLPSRGDRKRSLGARRRSNSRVGRFCAVHFVGHVHRCL